MSTLYGIDLPAIVASTASPTDWPTATLIRVAYAARVTSTGGKAGTESSYATRGVKTSSDDAGTPPGASLVQEERATIDLLGAPLAALGVEPAAKDLIADAVGGRWRIVSANPDPAKAVWSCRCVRA